MYLFLDQESSPKAINLDNVTRVTFNSSGNVTFFFGKDDSYTAKIPHQEARDALERYDVTRYGRIL